MKIVLEKQPAKYLASVDKPTRKKLEKALDGLKRLEGDIIKTERKRQTPLPSED